MIQHFTGRAAGPGCFATCVAVGEALGRAGSAGFQAVRVGRLVLGAILVLGGAVLARGAESPAAPPPTPPALVAFLRELLKAARTDPPALETIIGLKELGSAVSDERLRERLTCAAAIGLRYSGDLEGFSKLSKEMRTRYPESALLPRLEDDAFEEACAACGGTGETQHPCDKCGGTGSCSNSKCENGKIRYKAFKGFEVKPCPICRGAGKCLVCKGSGMASERCAACRGKGRRETTAHNREVFLSALDRCQAALDLPAPAPVAPPPETPPDAGKVQPGDAETTPSTAPESGKTPEHLVPLLKEYGSWLNVMQTRAGMPIAVRIRADDEAGRAVLHVTLTRELLRQPRVKRAQTVKALRGMWAEKVNGRRFNGRRLTPAAVFENDTGTVVRDSD